MYAGNAANAQRRHKCSNAADAQRRRQLQRPPVRDPGAGRGSSQHGRPERGPAVKGHERHALLVAARGEGRRPRRDEAIDAPGVHLQSRGNQGLIERQSRDNQETIKG